MLSTRLHLHWARLVIELPQGAALGSGALHSTDDMPFVRDANGLPTLPGSAIAGALQALLTRHALLTPAQIAALFGQPTDPKSKTDPTLSQLLVDFGYLHDASDTPRCGLIASKGIESDPVLKLCRTGISRQHAPHNHKGVALDGGLHNREHIPAGARFTLELRIESKDASDASVMSQLIAAFSHPALRLGGGKNNGLGAVKLVRSMEKAFNLNEKADLTAWMNWPVSPAQMPSGIDWAAGKAEAEAEAEAEAAKAGHLAKLTLTLPMESYWRTGTGAPSVAVTGEKASTVQKVLWLNKDKKNSADLSPLVEQRIVWALPAPHKLPSTGSTEQAVVVPGSSLKGVIAHQMAFEVRCALEEWADSRAMAELLNATPANLPRPCLVDALLGSASNAAGDADSSAAGSFWLQDTLIPIADVTPRLMTYVVIDQLSKGTVPGGLFTERVLCPHTIIVTGYLDCTATPNATALAALQQSLAMLCDGRLSIGAHSAAGHGFAEGGSCEWVPQPLAAAPADSAAVAAQPDQRDTLKAATL